MGLGAVIPDSCIRLGESPGFTDLYKRISSEAYKQGKPGEASELSEGGKKYHTGNGML